jgi:hydroxyacylglutathione hydrolase
MNVVTIPCFTDNFSYLIICTDTNEAAVVDPSDAAPVLEELKARAVSLRSVFCTHHHLDHVAGVEDLVRAVPDLRVFGHASDKGRIPCQNGFLEDGQGVSLGRIEGRVTHNPGHTSGGISYFLEDAVFTGDTLFEAGCGRLFEGSPEQMYTSLHQKIGSAPGTTRVYFGHEYTEQNLSFALSVEPENPRLRERVQSVRETLQAGRHTTPTTLDRERGINPFLRCDSPEIQAVVKAEEPGNDLSPVSVFRVLRAMKDRF